MSRSTEMIKNIPFATLGIIGLCSGVYVFQIVFDPDVHQYTMNPRMIVHLNEYYRLVTSTLFHGSLMHIGMNMVSTAAISSMLEKRFGTIRHAMTILWAILLTSFVYTAVALLLHLVFGYDNLMYQHSLGFSGVIFHMSILESNLSPQRSRSVFGFVTVPSYLYPWALLFALQLFMPNLSFLGHLAGILTGTLQLYGIFDFIMVGDHYIQDMETWSKLQCVTSRSNFVASPVSLDGGAPQIHRDPAALRRSLQNGIMMVLKFFKDVAATIMVCIFGRGRGNENIQLVGLGASTPGAPASGGRGDPIEEDDDWVGLPPMSPEGRGGESSVI